jgi:hypothetical protein
MGPCDSELSANARWLAQLRTSFTYPSELVTPCQASDTAFGFSKITYGETNDISRVFQDL